MNKYCAFVWKWLRLQFCLLIYKNKTIFSGSDSVNLSVLIKPVVSIIGSKNISIVEGAVIEVTCEVRAKPPPRILWHRETDAFLNNTVSTHEPAHEYDSYKNISIVEGAVICSFFYKFCTLISSEYYLGQMLFYFYYVILSSFKETALKISLVLFLPCISS